MLNVVHYSFVPNAASTNRLISYLVNVPKGIKCRVFFIMPDEHNSMWENNLENIQVVYCWKKFPAKFKLWKMLTFKLSLNFIKRIILEKSQMIWLLLQLIVTEGLSMTL